MSKDKVKKYVEENLEKGYSSEEIKKTLLDAGHNESEVEEIIAEVKSEGKEGVNISRIQLFIGSIIAVILISFVFYFVFYPEPTVKKAGTEKELLEKPEKMDFSCGELKKSTVIEACEICKRIKNPSMHNSCLAVVSNKSKECKSAGTNKNNCYWSLALRTGKVEYCDETDQKKSCQAILEDDIDGCQETSRPVFCYLYLAIEKNSPDICNKLKDNSALNYCSALVTENEDFCKEISNNKLRKSCFLKIAAEREDKSICEESGLTSSSKNACNILVEKRFDNLDCSKQEEVCREAIPYVQDSGFCKEVGVDIRDKCYQTLASVKLDLFPRKLYISAR